MTTRCRRVSTSKNVWVSTRSTVWLEGDRLMVSLSDPMIERSKVGGSTRAISLSGATLGKLFTHHSPSVRCPSLGALPTDCKYPNPKYYATSVTRRNTLWTVLKRLLISWPWSTVCSAWTHVWYTNVKRTVVSRHVWVEWDYGHL